MPGKKLWRRIALIAAIVLVVVLVAVYFSIDAIIRSQVVKATQAATGQTTHLAAARLHLLGGSLALDGLTIANPKDFQAPQFVDLQNVTVTVQPGSLLSNIVQVPSIDITGLHIVIEQNTINNNLQQILSAVQKARQATAAGGSTPSSAGKQLSIGRVLLHNTVVSFRMEAVPGLKGGDIDIKLPELTMDHPTNPDGRPLRIADLLGQVLAQSYTAAINDPRVPKQVRDVFNTLNTTLGKDLPDLLQNVGKSGGKDIGNIIQGVGQGIGGLLDQNKKDTTPAK